jgi:hypothetical protein
VGELYFQDVVEELKGFCWNTFQLVGYAVLDIIQSTKMAPFQKKKLFLSRGNKKKSRGLRSGE